MQTLLIWDMGSDGTSLYLIPDAPDWIVDVEGVLLNVTDSTEYQDKLILRISDALCNEPECYNDSKDELAGTWAKHDLSPGSTIEGPCRIVSCGWIG